MVQVLRNTRAIGFLAFIEAGKVYHFTLLKKGEIYMYDFTGFASAHDLLGSHGPSIAQYRDHRIQWNPGRPSSPSIVLNQDYRIHWNLIETNESYGPSIAKYLDHKIHWNQGILWSKYCAILGPWDSLKPRNPIVQVLRNTWPYGPSIAQYLNHRIHWNQGILWSKYCAILGPMVRILRNTWIIGLTTTKESAHRKGRPAIKLDGRSPVGLCPAMAFSVKKPKSPMVQVLRKTRTIGFTGFNKSFGPSRAPYSTMIALLGFRCFQQILWSKYCAILGP